MAERLTQLQDAVNMQAENFCNSIGILQQHAPPSFFPEFDKSSKANAIQPQSNEDFAQLFAQLIAKTAKEIDCLIESLPSEESTPELQAAHLRRLETENQDAAHRLQETVSRGEKLLEQIQKALQDIAQAQLKMQCLQNNDNLDTLSLDYGSSHSQ
ncbi:Mediator of RNA polymerase II transcription subunit 21 [Halotydeus destructor]|nr:Mediator of RNA polymerase II transcription subunit 21 [Halotydeus destructor]